MCAFLPRRSTTKLQEFFHGDHECKAKTQAHTHPRKHTHTERYLRRVLFLLPASFALAPSDRDRQPTGGESHLSLPLGFAKRKQAKRTYTIVQTHTAKRMMCSSFSFAFITFVARAEPDHQRIYMNSSFKSCRSITIYSHSSSFPDQVHARDTTAFLFLCLYCRAAAAFPERPVLRFDFHPLCSSAACAPSAPPIQSHGVVHGYD